MSFRATLSLGGKEHDVLNCTFTMNRDTDAKGRPSSGVYGGRITFEVESTSDTSIIESMVNNQFKPFDGSIIFKKSDEDAKMKEINFKNAYIVHYQEGIEAKGETPMVIKFTVSAESIKLGSADHDNRWPKS